MFFSVAAASTVLLPLRYAQVSRLGLGSGDCSAAEGLRLRRFLCILWFLGEKVKLWLVAAVGSLGLDLDRFHLRSGPFLLLVRRRFGLTLLGELVLEYNQGSCRSSSWFKGRLSMPPQRPPALLLHFESSLPDSLACSFSEGVCSSVSITEVRLSIGGGVRFHFSAGLGLLVLRELFSAEPISLRAVASGRLKLPGSDSRFNLVQSFAASGRYQTGRASGLLF
ncbi:hypothetical protein F2Q68_00025530 [Brassica cretica]|uniref:Uncharacterized protein n=1 Tax=Brassica cretica TaxID=69181 RepID=A0A8S9IF09_BRACR|nr:hypothetical protein F2Q68_00025530 [Brassica cretica]